MVEDKLSILPILKQIPFFSTFNEADHAEIIKNIQYQLFPANYTIFKEGDEADKMYIIRKGSVKVTRSSSQDKGESLVYVLKKDDFFGEMALFSDSKRNATVTTLEESELFTLSKEDLFALIQGNQDMAGRVNEEFLKRLKRNEELNKKQNS